MGYVSDAQRKAVHASKADGGKGAPTNFGMPVTGQNPFMQYQTQNKALSKRLLRKHKLRHQHLHLLIILWIRL